MVEQRLFFSSSSREKPRNIGFLPERGGTSTNSKAMPPELFQKPPSQILDRFRALLKEREEELRVSNDENNVSAPSPEEIVRLYEVVLSELTFNSKPIITDLTIIADEQRECAEGIAEAICARIIEVPVEQKLPSLYLLDSIVKNISGEYIRYFASLLPKVFCEAYKQVHPSLCPAMRHLFGTWSAVFPTSVLQMIGAELQFSPNVNHHSSGSTALKSFESSSPRPAHGIHINPKYLEARRQFEHATLVNISETDPNGGAARMTAFKGRERVERSASTSPNRWSGASPKFHDIQDARGISSNKQMYGQKPPFGYGGYDTDHADVITPHTGIRRLGSPGVAAHTSFVGGGKGLLPSSKTRLLRPSSPSRVGLAESLLPSVDGFMQDNSPGRAVERVSPSHSEFEFGPGRKRSNWWTKHGSASNHQQIETSSAFNHSNGRDQQRPRGLIDAYGNYREKNTLNKKPPNVEQLDVIGIKNEAATRWQNTEEEEYVWEEMSPTLANHRGSDLMPSGSPLGNLSTRTGIGGPAAALLEPDFRRGNSPKQAWPPAMDAAAIIAVDGISILGPGHGSISNKSVGGSKTQNETTQIQGSHHSQEPWNLPHHIPIFSQQLNPNASGKAVQMVFPATGTSSSGGQKVPSLIDKVPDTAAQFRSLSSVMSRLGSSSYDSFRQLPHSPPMAPPPIWHPVNTHNSHHLLSLPILPQQSQIKGQFDMLDADKLLMNQGSKGSLILPQQHLNAFEREVLISHKLRQFPNQQGGLISSNNQSLGQAALLHRQFLKTQEARESFTPPIPAQVSSHLVVQPLNHEHTLQGHGALMSTVSLPKIPGVPSSSVTIHSIPHTSFQLQIGALPPLPLPPGPPLAASHMGPASQNMGPIVSNPSGGSAFSGLISSLMAQGLIALTTPDTIQDSVGVEFNLDLLKLRHESAITALYADLPRQCTTCGLRFKSQEGHSTHMDWHVSKNRISKNRNQKPSRKWFVSTNVWLSGAEALGADAVPGFLPTEAIVEKKDDEEMAVPADENQNVCALCGEPFDDFYSDETEEWMYKGAVYLNALDGSTAGVDKSQLGPIVHAKCRSESTVISPEDFGLDEGVILHSYSSFFHYSGSMMGGKTDEHVQRKRMRV